MFNNRLFFVNVCRRLVCAVYFVIVPIGYTSSFAVYTYQYVIVTLNVNKWT